MILIRSLYLVLLIGIDALDAQAYYTAKQAASHIGEKITVCGKVASSIFLHKSRSKVTLLNIDQPYPDQIFTVVIPYKSRIKFIRPEVQFLNKEICITGSVTIYKRTPEIIVYDPDQIQKK
jgi:DNA/RNA endonuclease YhcR with UshA esterase domain